MYRCQVELQGSCAEYNIVASPVSVPKVRSKCIRCAGGGVVLRTMFIVT